MVQQAFETDMYSLSHAGGLVKSLTSLNFLSFDCVFKATTCCNRAAHELARLGVSCVEGEVHITCNAPDSVFVIVADDL
jgi:hypothetical protein